jgi:hypothetical protein
MTASPLASWLRRQYRFLGSGRLAVVLLTTLVLLLGLYLLIPQGGEAEAELLQRWAEQKGLWGRLCLSLGFTDIQHSWWLYATYALFFVNLLLCMIRRFRTTLRLYRFPEEPPQISPLWLHREAAATGLEAESVADLLRRKGYRVLLDGETVYGLRGRFAGVGHWVFHVSLLLLLAAGIFVAATPDPFRGTVGIGEGETFDLHTAAFLSTNMPPARDLPELRFQMHGIDVLTQNRELRRFAARLSTPEGEEATLGINRPYRKSPYQVVLHGFGFMPGWVIVNARGRMLRGAWVKLLPFPLRAEDSFPLGVAGSTVHVVRFHADDERVGKEARSGRQARNPRFEVRVVWRGEKIYEGSLAPDQRIPLEDGQEFFFLPEVRRYSLVDVMYERGHGIVFGSLGIMILGLVIRYVRLRKEILVRAAGGSLQVFGRSEIFENLFEEEFDRLAGELASANLSSAQRKGAT